jgi:hypothetical protein
MPVSHYDTRVHTREDESKATCQKEAGPAFDGHPRRGNGCVLGLIFRYRDKVKCLPPLFSTLTPWQMASESQHYEPANADGSRQPCGQCRCTANKTPPQLPKLPNLTPSWLVSRLGMRILGLLAKKYWTPESVRLQWKVVALA